MKKGKKFENKSESIIAEKEKNISEKVIHEKEEKKKEFDISKTISKHTMFFPGLFDPPTAKLAKFFYNLGISANMMTAITFAISILTIIVLVSIRNYTGLVIAAILLFIRNITDGIDGKIARGSGTVSGVGGFADIITDWLFFHAAFFIAIGYITGHIVIGFLCVTGYMSREFARRKFTEKYGIKITETNEAKNSSLIVSIVRRYDLGEVNFLSSIILLLNPVWIIYTVAVIEYSLLFGELGFDAVCLLRKARKENENCSLDLVQKINEKINL